MAAIYVQPDVKRRIEIGDLVSRVGIYTKPGVVEAVNPNGEVVINTEPIEIEKYHRHAITTGLNIAEKAKFNEIMDSIQQLTNNDDKLNTLQRTIDELKTTYNPKDENNKINLKVANSLTNEQAKLIRSTRELPRIYSVQSNKLGA